VYADDFMIDAMTASFSTGNVSINQTVCIAFRTQDDKIIEDVETFSFNAYALNPLDDFEMGRDNFMLQIYDDEGISL